MVNSGGGPFCRLCGAQLSDNSKFCPKCGTPVQLAPQAKPVIIPEHAQPISPRVNLSEATTFARERISKDGKLEAVVEQLVSWGVMEPSARSIVVGIEEEVRHEKKKRWRNGGVKLIATGIILFFVIVAAEYTFFPAPNSTTPSEVTTVFGLVYLLLVVIVITGVVYVARSLR